MLRGNENSYKSLVGMKIGAAPLENKEIMLGEVIRSYTIRPSNSTPSCVSERNSCF